MLSSEYGVDLRETVAKLVALQTIDDEGRAFREERDGLRCVIVRLKELRSHEEQLAEKRVKFIQATSVVPRQDGS